MSRHEQAARQRSFYETRDHQHLQPRDRDFYADRMAERLARGIGIQSHHRVLELGAGFGRFTFSLLQHCESVVALDLSPRALANLEATRERRKVSPERCATLCLDIDRLDPGSLDRRVDFVVGFFFLHHLPDFPATIALLANRVAPAGGMAFVEPNRRNPLFLAQVMCCPDMTWREEKGMFQLSARKVEAAYREAGFSEIHTRSFGFFPPPLLNHLSWARSLEIRLEQMHILRGVLPMLLLGARA
ncbi:MAG: class I SAM-dependent methyltransferase [Proteobacteria bacterium]|nr:class I SAM-dependent methyltransferase [Pseudomonadota bacterium]